MKKLALFIIMISVAFAKDFEFQVEKFDEQLLMPRIDKSMSYEEFEVLSTKYGTKDMLYALVVPGYVHFKNKDYYEGGLLAALRLASYGGLYYLSSQQVTQESVNAGNVLLWIAVGTYLYDWIVGVNVHEMRVNTLRYKYAIKVEGDKVGVGVSF